MSETRESRRRIIHGIGTKRDAEVIVRAHDRLREELMRCGLLAVSERLDGCIPKTTALRIRQIATDHCWPTSDGGK